MFGVLVVVATLAPRRFASWMAIVQTPPEPARTWTVWPDCRFTRSTNACQHV